MGGITRETDKTIRIERKVIVRPFKFFIVYMRNPGDGRIDMAGGGGGRSLRVNSISSSAFYIFLTVPFLFYSFSFKSRNRKEQMLPKSFEKLSISICKSPANILRL